MCLKYYSDFRIASAIVNNSFTLLLNNIIVNSSIYYSMFYLWKSCNIPSADKSHKITLIKLMPAYTFFLKPQI